MPVKDFPYRGFLLEAATTALIAHGWVRREERQHFTAYCVLRTLAPIPVMVSHSARAESRWTSRFDIDAGGAARNCLLATPQLDWQLPVAWGKDLQGGSG